MSARPAPRTIRRALILVAIGLSILAIGIAAFPRLFERVEQTDQLSPYGQARTNDWFALAQTLDKLGVPTVSRYGLGALPSRDSVILLLSDQREVRRDCWQRASDWVIGGGHLVITADTLWSDVDGSAPDTGASADPAEMDVIENHLGMVAVRSAATEAFLTGPQGRIRELFAPPVRALRSQVQPGAAWLASDQQAWAMRFDYGDGLVTVITSARVFDNNTLGQADHALLAWDLLQREGQPPDQVVMVLAGESLSLLAVLWRAASPLLISALVLTLVFAWRGAVRAAPVHPAPAPARRDLMEHIEASGTWLWRRGLRDQLIEGGRAAIRRRRSLGLASLDAASLDAASLDQDTQDAACLSGPAPSSPTEFLNLVRRMQRLWKQS
ncbi:MAG: DUF4350 domain-containing protein [Oligoflexia bacterium]|nr:DUF4350 domain-containing protein [Oligoflexia bacterium]